MGKGRCLGKSLPRVWGINYITVILVHITLPCHGYNHFGKVSAGSTIRLKQLNGGVVT